MARQQGKAGEKGKGGKRLKVKKQPLKDLEGTQGRAQRVKAGARKIPIGLPS
jgi:hypothetical protein